MELMLYTLSVTLNSFLYMHMIELNHMIKNFTELLFSNFLQFSSELQKILSLLRTNKQKKLWKHNFRKYNFVKIYIILKPVYFRTFQPISKKHISKSKFNN